MGNIRPRPYKTSDLKSKITNLAQTSVYQIRIQPPAGLSTLLKEVGRDFIIVTPGIRPETYNSTFDDQKRTLTPKKAIDLGADFLVIGRPITESKNPLEVVKKINQSLN